MTRDAPAPRLSTLFLSRKFVAAMLVVVLLVAGAVLAVSHFVWFSDERTSLWTNVATGVVDTLVGGVVVAVLLYVATTAAESGEDTQRWQQVERAVVSDVGGRLMLHTSYLRKAIVAILPEQVHGSVRLAMLDLGDIRYAMSELTQLIDGLTSLDEARPVPDEILEDFGRLYMYLGDVALPLLGDLRRDPEFILGVAEMRIGIVRYLSLASGSQGIVGNSGALWWSTKQLFTHVTMLNDLVSARDPEHAETQRFLAGQIARLEKEHPKEEIASLFGPTPS